MDLDVQYEQDLRPAQSWILKWDVAAQVDQPGLGNLCQVLYHLPASEAQTPRQARKWL